MFPVITPCRRSSQPSLTMQICAPRQEYPNTPWRCNCATQHDLVEQYISSEASGILSSVSMKQRLQHPPMRKRHIPLSSYPNLVFGSAAGQPSWPECTRRSGFRRDQGYAHHIAIAKPDAHARGFITGSIPPTRAGELHGCHGWGWNARLQIQPTGAPGDERRKSASVAG